MSCVLLMCTIIGNTDTDSDTDIYRTLYVVMRRDKFVVLFRIWGFASRGCSLDLLVSSQGMEIIVVLFFYSTLLFTHVSSVRGKSKLDWDAE